MKEDSPFDTPAPDDADSWANLLRANWEQRSRTDERDFYVASHRGWKEPARWESQAESDVNTLFYGIAPEACRAWNVLELGCGVGRLVGPITSRVGTYTGFDISLGMVEEATRRCAENPAARFFLGDGLGLPAEVKDKTYELILVAAVFIHCPRSVIRQNVVSAFAQLSKGGELRLQVLADIEDPEGISSLPEADLDHQEMQAVQDEVEGGPILNLIDGHYYMGDRFGYRDLEEFLVEATAAEVVVFRPTLQHMYAIVRAPV